ncbi:MAG TPA: hypothetical protein VHX66_07885 [Solirubrobacteraceae bacterium]|jgi:hypothetical protein|nr:hypothetical protein [Solirubrobacteraceae bacterium]
MRRSAVVLATVLAGIGATNAGAAAAWSGLGAKLADFVHAHPKYKQACPTGGCYGRRIRAGGRLTAQFIELGTAGSQAQRVDAYVQAIGDGTSLGSAKKAVTALLPSDAYTVSFRIVHSRGDSCVLWTMRSKTLGRWLTGTAAHDAHGYIAINLNTPTHAGFAYKPRDVSEAIVSTRSNASDVTC